MFKMICLLFFMSLFFTESFQSCLRIEQDGQGIVNQRTNLRCELQEGAIGLTQFILRWHTRSPPRNDAGRQKLAELTVNGASESLVVTSGYEDKVSASYEDKALTLTILSISLDDDEQNRDWYCEISGVLPCSPKNVAHHIQVIVPPTSESMELSGLSDGWVIHEQPYTLTCTADPIKPEASVYWSIDGETQLETFTTSELNEDGTVRVTGVLSGYQFSKKKNSAVNVSCLVTENNQPASVIFTQSYKHVDVYYRPEGPSFLSVTPARSEIAVGEAVTFTCQHMGVSNPQPNRFTFYKGGEQQQSSPSNSWILGTSSIHDGGDFSCEASNSVGTADRSQKKVITVQAPATIEEFPADAQSPEYDAEFSMACVGAGNERTVEWTKDSADLPEEDFVDDGSGTVEGSYSFGQEAAYRKKYRWIPATEESCSTVEERDGEYTCTVTATAGGTETRISSTMQLSVRYPPINNVSDFVAVHVGLREAVTLPCDVCANPEPTQYTWSRPDGAVLETSGISLTISNVTEEDFGNYTCSVTNSIASRTFVVLLAALGVPEQPSDFRVEPKTSRSVDLSWKPEFNGGLTQTFELDGRKVGDRTYVNIKRNIADPNTHPKDDQTVSLTVDLIGEVNQTPLQPYTRYEFRVRGENSHEDKYGPYAYADGRTNESPVVKLNADTLRYSYETTHLFFEWKIEAGKPDKLELQYRETQSQSQSRRRPRSTEWITMVTVDPDPGFYDGVTEVELDPDRSYELRLVPFEGAQSTTPPDEEATSLKPIPPPGFPGLVIGMVMAVVCVAGVAIAGTVYVKRRNKKADGSTPIMNESQEQVGMTHQTFTGPGAQAQLDNAAYATVDMAAKARSRGPPPPTPTPTPLTKLPPIPTPPPTDEPQPSTSKEGYDDPKPGTSLEMTTDSEEEENPYADAPPMYDHYVEGDIYAMVGPPDKILYSNYPGQEKVESEYWDVIYLGPEKEVNIPPRFEEPIYDWIDFTKEPGPADSDSD